MKTVRSCCAGGTGVGARLAPPWLSEADARQPEPVLICRAGKDCIAGDEGWISSLLCGTKKPGIAVLTAYGNGLTAVIQTALLHSVFSAVFLALLVAPAIGRRSRSTRRRVETHPADDG